MIRGIGCLVLRPYTKNWSWEQDLEIQLSSVKILQNMICHMALYMYQHSYVYIRIIQVGVVPICQLHGDIQIDMLFHVLLQSGN